MLGGFSSKVGLRFASRELNSKQVVLSLPTKAAHSFLFLAAGYQTEIKGAENQMLPPNA